MWIRRSNSIEKFYDVSENFDTVLARKFDSLHTSRKSTVKETEEYLKVCVDYTHERERLFRQLLELETGQEPMRAEVRDLSLTLFRKLATIMSMRELNHFSDGKGFFVYNPHKPKVIAIIPKGHSIEYWMIDGIRMRAMEVHIVGKLARIGYLLEHIAYLQPKVLDHEEYEHLIELLSRELEEYEGEGGGENGLSQRNHYR